LVAFEKAGGERTLGCGFNPEHEWGPGVIQDLRGGVGGDAAIMALTPDHAYVLAGRAWRDYESQAGRDTGPRAGFPISNPYRCGNSKMFELASGSVGAGAMVTKVDGEFIWLSGAIWSRYRALGGPAGRLGSPTAFDSTGQRQPFERGWISAPPGAALARTDLEDSGGQEPPPPPLCLPS
jgi:uncharacterized protein with LGFP repeats